MSWQTTTTGLDKDKGFHSDTVWQDLNVPAEALSRGLDSPDSELLIGNIKALAFDGVSREEELFGSFELLHGYKEGTDLRPHIHFITSSVDIGDIKWQLEYTIAYVDGTYSTTTTTVAIDTANGIDRQHLAVEFGVIDGTGLKIGSHIHFRLFRNPSDTQDTYESDAFLSSIGIHYEIDGDGSRNTFTK